MLVRGSFRVLTRPKWADATIEKAARWAATSLERCYRVRTGNGRARGPPGGWSAAYAGSFLDSSSLGTVTSQVT